MILVGGYHEYRGGCSVPWGTQITKDFSSTFDSSTKGFLEILREKPIFHLWKAKRVM